MTHTSHYGSHEQRIEAINQLMQEQTEAFVKECGPIFRTYDWWFTMNPDQLRIRARERQIGGECYAAVTPINHPNLSMEELSSLVRFALRRLRSETKLPLVEIFETTPDLRDWHRMQRAFYEGLSERRPSTASDVTPTHR